MERITKMELESAGFYWREHSGVRALVCSALEADGFVNGFSTRSGGVSTMPEGSLNLAGFHEDAAENILENRRRFLKLFPGEWTLAGCWQVHGSDVRVVTDVADAKPAENSLGETVYCDAVVSRASHVLAAVKTADCVPLLIADPVTKCFAAVHAGWRGTFAGVVLYTLERLEREYQVSAGNLCVAIGPAAAECCYEVGPEVIEGFRERFTYAEGLLEPTLNGHARIDLLKANQRQLTDAGVKSDRIHIAPLCTMCRTDLFFSYRREKKQLGKVGRLMGVIGKAS
jgi:YfiH family protein